MQKRAPEQGSGLERISPIISAASEAIDLALSARNSVLESGIKGDLTARLCEYLHINEGENVVTALAVLLGRSEGMDKKASQIRSIFDTERKQAPPQIHIVFKDNTFNIETFTLHQSHQQADSKDAKDS